MTAAPRWTWLPGWLRSPVALPTVLGTALLPFVALRVLLGAPLPTGPLAVIWPVTNVYLLLLALRVALRRGLDPRLRRGWAAFALGSVLGLAGDLSWALLGGASSRLSEFFYMVEYPLWGLGLLLLPVEPPQPGQRARIAMDLGTVFIAATVAIWDAILRPMAATHAAQPLDLLLAASSPVGDLLVLTGAAALLQRGPDRSTGSAILALLASMMLYSALDFVWAWQDLHGLYVEGRWIDVGWLLARLLLAWSALRQLAPPAGARVEAITAQLLRWSATVMPIAATALGFVLILRVVAAEELDRGTVGTGVGAVALCLLVLARQTHHAIVNASLNARLTVETEKSERLLLNVLPPSIARQLKDGRKSEPLAESFEEATVLFADLVGFTPLSSKTTPTELVNLLDDIFTRFDALADQHGLEKIKTIGDAYMAVCGVPIRRPDHAAAAARMALGMRDAIAQIARARAVNLQIRIGLHCGPVVAGVIGHRKFAYDLWGDAVNTASRMESHGQPGAIHVSGALEARLREGFLLEARGTVPIKGKGPMETFFLLGERAAPGPR